MSEEETLIQLALGTISRVDRLNLSTDKHTSTKILHALLNDPNPLVADCALYNLDYNFRIDQKVQS